MNLLARLHLHHLPPGSRLPLVSNLDELPSLLGENAHEFLNVASRGERRRQLEWAHPPAGLADFLPLQRQLTRHLAAGRPLE